MLLVWITIAVAEPYLRPSIAVRTQHEQNQIRAAVTTATEKGSTSRFYLLAFSSSGLNRFLISLAL